MDETNPFHHYVYDESLMHGYRVQYGERVERYPIVERMHTNIQEFIKKPTLNANMLFMLNFCPVEYVVQKNIEDELKQDESDSDIDILTVGILTHRLMPLVYYLWNVTNKESILSRLVESSYNHPDKTSIFRESYFNCCSILDRVIHQIAHQRNVDLNKVTHLFAQTNTRHSDNWILFEPQLGPRSFGKTFVFCEPDAVLCIDGALYVLEWKTNPYMDTPLYKIVGSPALRQPIVPGMSNTYRAQAIFFLLMCRYILFGKLKKMSTIVLASFKVNNYDARKCAQAHSLSNNFIEKYVPLNSIHCMREFFFRPYV